MPRFFTHAQAQSLIPEVEHVVREAIFQKNEYQEAEAELQGVNRRIALLGGIHIDRERMSRQKDRRESGGRKLKEAVDTIHSYGCILKDLDTGLLDFPTLYNGEEVYLCWKLGEQEIGFWHATTEGFAGRKAINSDFLDSHQGDLTN